MRVGVVGAGAWGTSLASLLAAKGEAVRLWALEGEVAEGINSNRCNQLYLPEVEVAPDLVASTDLAEVIAPAEAVVTVTPSHVLREIAGRMAGHLSPAAILISATKGIEETSLLTMTGVLAQVLSPADPQSIRDRLAVLSGPSFAREVVAGSPTAVTVAAYKSQTAQFVQGLFGTDRFRVYTCPDVIGVELGGALKNVMAIAAGICQGLGLGDNTLAALITRGLAEMSRLGVSLGAEPLTFLGLSGVGDLVLTCTSPQSRNYTVGLKLGQGMKMAEILAGMRAVAEGVRTTRSAVALARRHEVEMPICTQIYAVIEDGADPKEALAVLMRRDPKLERWGLE
ncbi:MAG: NAD(P)-dependent glycerol-3-phosphate dehydrogenase [Deltaproteobacteria bacterium]|nr:NAD(P)-dependent glycerol-3-phosphate dehydrogenase [Deltaproteobacteria bacterium]